MTKAIIEYLSNIVLKWPPAKTLLAVLRLFRIRLTHFLVSHPIVAVCALVVVCATSLIAPAESYLSRPAKCFVIEARGNELYKKDGDVLRFGEQRPCDPGHVVAFEFFNYGPTRIKQDSHPIDLVSAGIFIKESALNDEAPNQWHELSVFKKVNDFLWTVHGSPTFEGGFFKNECRYDPNDTSARNNIELRQGLLLRSEAQRSNTKLEYKTWLKCNYGIPGKPEFKACNYAWLDLFVPTIAPERWCGQSGGLSVEGVR